MFWASVTVAVSAMNAAYAATSRTRGRSKALVVVESPAKARTIKKYLGAAYIVKASVGHVKDLPKSKMGVDVEHGFAPEYEVISGKKKVIGEIKKAAKEVERVYLAPDPDREGEAIAWHLAEEIRDANPAIFNKTVSSRSSPAMVLIPISSTSFVIRDCRPSSRNMAADALEVVSSTIAANCRWTPSSRT